MAVAPDEAELIATIARMEARFDAMPDLAAQMGAYRRVCGRFADDLANPRDLALSRAAALMMITYSMD